MIEYKSLIDALKIVQKARREVTLEQSAASPAWSFLYRVGLKLEDRSKQAFAEMIGEVEVAE